MSAADKQDLRDELLQERRALTADQIDRARSAVRGHILEERRRAGWTRIAAYVPLRTEPGSVELLDELLASGATVIVPITRDDRDLDWTVWGAAAGPLGVEAISAVDSILVPALAVAADGTRLGRGGGSYDRALPRAQPNATIAALLYADEVRENLPSEAWDVPVTAYVTPDGWHPIRRWNA
jgi:5-formyltetrahydrofolate cyclo-ligase